MDFLRLFKFNPNHDSLGRFATGGLDNAEFTAADRRLVDIKPARPLGTEGVDDLKLIADLIPGAEYVPYSQTPFFARLQELQGVSESVNGAQNKIARDALFEQQPIEDIPIEHLVFTQNVVNYPDVLKFHPGEPGYNPALAAKGTAPAQVVLYKGSYYLVDGHHRVISEILRGEKHLRSYVLHIEDKVKKVELECTIKFNPFHDELGRFTFAGPRAGYFPKIKEVPKLVNRLLGSAREVEPEVTSTLGELAAMYGGGLTGLENRLKSGESLARKIRDIAKIERRDVETVAGEIKDALRYTIVLPTEDYARASTEIAQALTSRGYGQIKHANYWGDNSAYKGINDSYKDAHGQIFELQFHTNDSLALKERNHALYEVARLATTSTAMRTQLEQMMRENARHVKLSG